MTEPKTVERKFPLIIQIILVAVAYFLGGKIGLTFAEIQPNTTAFWPPTGIGIAVLLVLGFRIWPGIFLGAFFIELSENLPVSVSLGICLGNTLEALIGAMLIQKLIGKGYLSSAKSILLLVVSMLIASFCSATIGVGSLLVGGLIEDKIIHELWYTWSLADLFGGILLVPFILSWAKPPDIKMSTHSMVAGILLSASTIMLTSYMFSPLSDSHIANPSVPILLLFLAIWAGYQFSFHGATLFAICMVSIATYGTSKGFGPFALTSLNDSLLAMQIFLGAIIVASLIVAAIVAQEKKSHFKLRKHQEDLEVLVEKRLFELREANNRLKDEVKNREQTNNALCSLHEVSSHIESRKALSQCTQDISRIYDTTFSFFGLFSNKEKSAIKTEIFMMNQNVVPNIEYCLAGTPCEDVLNRKLEFIGRDVAKLYPRDVMLKEQGVESYFAAPLVGTDGSTIGIVAVLDVKPMSLETWSRPLLTLYANRIAVEIERSHIEAERNLSEAVFQSSVQSIAISDQHGTILRVNQAFERTTGFSCGEIIGNNFRLMKSGKHDIAFYQKFWSSVIHDGWWQGEIWNCRKNGEIYPVWQTVASVIDTKNNAIKYFVSIFSDITDKKQSEEKLYQLAHFDTLTGLHNRLSFTSKLQTELLHSKKENKKLALIFLDLDHFKSINDAYGHHVGDQLLMIIAQRLKHVVRNEDMVARLAGDEFVIMISQFFRPDDLSTIAQKTLDVISKPMTFDEVEIKITTSLGISIFPDNASDLSSLLKRADIAMYTAKKSGKNNFQFYSPDINIHADTAYSLEREMHNGLKNDEFFLVYQPQYHIEKNSITGYEALIRWMHPERGLMMPEDFIPIAENSDFIQPLGNWVLRSACYQLREWIDQGLNDASIGVNVSSRQIHGQDLAQLVLDILNETGVPANRLELELTESVVIHNIERVAGVFRKLTNIGVRIAIDDFGTGYSSLICLKRFPLYRLKIDRSFVKDIIQNAEDKAIVNATISLAENLSLSLVAEGVETQAQLDYLKKLGCYEFQGFYLSPPMPASDVIKGFVEMSDLNPDLMS